MHVQRTRITRPAFSRALMKMRGHTHTQPPYYSIASGQSITTSGWSPAPLQCELLAMPPVAPRIPPALD